jgi:hypothetical protein
LLDPSLSLARSLSLLAKKDLCKEKKEHKIAARREDFKNQHNKDKHFRVGGSPV